MVNGIWEKPKRTYDLLFDNLTKNLFIDEICISEQCVETGKEIQTENKKFNQHIITWGKFFVIKLLFVSLI